LSAGTGSTIRHGFYNTSSGKRRRYRCRTCGKTFCANTGTPYHRLQHRRATFDEVATLSVEGLNKSAIARVKQIAWNPSLAGSKRQPIRVVGSTIEK
jgi:transposase-like protein